ncbi:MAG: TIGR04149 family rSAM-modified RiPP [Bacteroidaceae bacterium]
MKSLKLNQIENSRLAKNEMKHIMGGRYTMIVGNCVVSYTCSCGCQYANSGGSSTDANKSANRSGGLRSSNATVWCDVVGDCG